MSCHCDITIIRSGDLCLDCEMEIAAAKKARAETAEVQKKELLAAVHHYMTTTSPLPHNKRQEEARVALNTIIDKMGGNNG